MVNLNTEISDQKGNKVLIVEDVITTGRSSIECSKLVLSNEANVLVMHVLLIDQMVNLK